MKMAEQKNKLAAGGQWMSVSVGWSVCRKSLFWAYQSRYKKLKSYFRPSSRGGRIPPLANRRSATLL